MKSMFRTAVAVVALPLFASAPFHEADAQSFEGVISIRLNGDGPNGPRSMDADYLVSRSGKARINMPMASMIMSPAENKLYMLVESQASYVEQDLGSLVSQASDRTRDVKVTHTGRKEVIAGYECEHMIVNEIDVCGAKGLGNYLTIGGNVMAGNVAAWQQAMLRDGVFPLKVTKADGTVQMQVTKIERKAMDASLFRVPDHFRKMPGRTG